MTRQEHDDTRIRFAIWWNTLNNDDHRPSRMKARGNFLPVSLDYPGLRFKTGKRAGAGR
jgi:hypothetical protein